MNFGKILRRSSKTRISNNATDTVAGMFNRVTNTKPQSARRLFTKRLAQTACWLLAWIVVCGSMFSTYMLISSSQVPVQSQITYIPVHATERPTIDIQKVLQVSKLEQRRRSRMPPHLGDPDLSLDLTRKPPRVGKAERAELSANGPVDKTQTPIFNVDPITGETGTHVVSLFKDLERFALHGDLTHFPCRNSPKRHAVKIPFCPMLPQHYERYKYIRASKAKYYIAMNLYNSHRVIPNLSAQLVNLAEFFSPERLFVSIYENGSKDNTPAQLEILKDTLDNIGVENVINSDPGPPVFTRLMS